MEEGINAITCRGLIIHEDKLLIVRLKPGDNFYCLPGGKLEKYEQIEECMTREIKEELGIDAVIGKILFINQMLTPQHNKHVIEFFYHIINSQDFLKINASSASHAFEISEIVWSDIYKDNHHLLPDFIKPELRNIDWNQLENHHTKIIVSR